MNFVSMDTSTKKSGLAFYQDGELKDYELIDFEKIRDVDIRINEMGKAIIDRLNIYSPTLLYIEIPKGHGRNLELVRKLATVMGIVRGWCLANECEYHDVMPSVWRGWCPDFNQGGKERDELKEESIFWVKRKYGYEVNDDVADAICLGAGVLKHFE